MDSKLEPIYTIVCGMLQEIFRRDRNPARIVKSSHKCSFYICTECTTDSLDYFYKKIPSLIAYRIPKCNECKCLIHFRIRGKYSYCKQLYFICEEFFDEISKEEKLYLSYMILRCTKNMLNQAQEIAKICLDSVYILANNIVYLINKHLEMLIPLEFIL